MELNNFEIPVFGQTIRFKSDKDKDYLEVLKNKFLKKLEEIQKVSPSVEPLKLLVLLSLNLLDEYEELFKKMEGENQLIEEELKALTLKISQFLGEKND